MKTLFYALGTIVFILTEGIIIYACFQEGIWKGLIGLILYQINPFTLIFFIPSFVLFWLGSKFEGE